MYLNNILHDELLKARLPVVTVKTVNDATLPNQLLVVLEETATPQEIVAAENIRRKFSVPYQIARREEFKELKIEDQLDALYKGLDIVIPALIEGRKLTAEEAALLTPDKTKPVDTPAGWRGKVKDIKERNPKP